MSNFLTMREMEKATGLEIPQLIIGKADLGEWCKLMGNHPMLGPNKRK